MLIERLKFFFGASLSRQEFKKFSLLSIIFSITIGVFWLFRPLKDGIFLTMVGTKYLPFAKLASVIIVVPVIMIYSKLIDFFSRHTVLYGLSLLYAAIAVVFAFFILDPTIGIANTNADPSRLLGWAFYLYIEAFGTIMAALFWSFVADTTSPDSAKRGYSLIVMGAQIGAICLPLVSKAIITFFGTGYSILFGVFVLCFLPIMVFYYMKHVVGEQMQGFKSDENRLDEETHKTGFFEGLRLLATKSYLLGIFTIVSFYEIINALLDYQFKTLAKLSYTGELLIQFLNDFAIVTNVIALLCIVLGIDRIGRILGFGKALALLPILVGLSAVIMNFYPLLHVAFVIMAIQKSFNYSLNHPIKEQLYIPTTKATKYKSKAWIDMFGSRLSKGGGSIINNMRGLCNSQEFIIVSLLISFGLIGIWMIAALFVGKVHAQAIKEDKAIC